ncbi:aminoglycoside 6-adenylyltransferase [Terribacillus halophilus]|uniref:aminoglycoside 6-adenylyltransferase n=1 Tax=Terribacillus halophilus TaxID=361279 RepID=UPI0009869756|nr:aminoglycoside 6-adenylyltransferase [Terribacillus halophilus]
MYSPQVRDKFYNDTITNLTSSDLVEGIVRIGSGVIGYNDDYSDIDLMVSTTDTTNVEHIKDYVHQCLAQLGAVYIKDKRHRENVYIIIAILENGLEFNVSTLPTSYLSVRSPLWKVIVDKTGRVSEEMNMEQERFASQFVKYDVNEDIPFEFVFSMRRFNIELKRNNLIYALKMLEMMRDYVLEIEAHNEGKKVHQFKAYETLRPSFIEAFLDTHPNEVTVERLLISADKLKDLFLDTIYKSELFIIENGLINLLNSVGDD